MGTPDFKMMAYHLKHVDLQELRDILTFLKRSCRPGRMEWATAGNILWVRGVLDGLENASEDQVATTLQNLMSGVRLQELNWSNFSNSKLLSPASETPHMPTWGEKVSGWVWDESESAWAFITGYCGAKMGKEPEMPGQQGDPTLEKAKSSGWIGHVKYYGQYRYGGKAWTSTGAKTVAAAKDGDVKEGPP